MGSNNQRVLGLIANEAILLNSRDKAPFLLFIEVLDTDQEEKEINEQNSKNITEICADSANSINNIK